MPWKTYGIGAGQREILKKNALTKEKVCGIGTPLEASGQSLGRYSSLVD
jgi:hypothetical protein